MTAMLEAIIGLVFVFFLVSMVCSAINEFLAQELGRRGKFLREGIVNLVQDRWVYLRIIHHPVVSSLYRNVPGKPKSPAYLPAWNFANALLDTVLLKAKHLAQTPGRPSNQTASLQPGSPAASPTFQEIRDAAVRCKNAGYTIGDTVVPLLDAAEGSVDQARKNIEAWYESGMERVSGWYKKYTRRLLLLTGLVVAVLFNVDTLEIAKRLMGSAELRRSLADAAHEVVETKRFAGTPMDLNEGDLKIAKEDLLKFAAGISEYEKTGLPVGFSCLVPLGSSTNGKSSAPTSSLGDTLLGCWNNTKQQSGGAWLLKIIGWLATAVAVSLGAPFWFDLLNKVVDLRGAGRKPAAPPSPEMRPAPVSAPARPMRRPVAET